MQMRAEADSITVSKLEGDAGVNPSMMTPIVRESRVGYQSPRSSVPGTFMEDEFLAG